MSNKSNEKIVTIIILIVSVVAAMAISPKDRFFLGNFADIWLPQGIVFALLFLFRFRLAIISGAAISLTIALIGYTFFHDAMAWIGYYFVVPAGFLGALVYGLATKSKEPSPYYIAIAYSALFAIIAIAITQLILCSTVMYCGWK